MYYWIEVIFLKHYVCADRTKTKYKSVFNILEKCIKPGKLSLSCDNSDKIEPNLIFLLKA